MPDASEAASDVTVPPGGIGKALFSSSYYLAALKDPRAFVEHWCVTINQPEIAKAYREVKTTEDYRQWARMLPPVSIAGAVKGLPVSGSLNDLADYAFRTVSAGREGDNLDESWRRYIQSHPKEVFDVAGKIYDTYWGPQAPYARDLLTAYGRSRRADPALPDALLDFRALAILSPDYAADLNRAFLAGMSKEDALAFITKPGKAGVTVPTNVTPEVRALLENIQGRLEEERKRVEKETRAAASQAARMAAEQDHTDRMGEIAGGVVLASQLIGLRDKHAAHFVNTVGLNSVAAYEAVRTLAKGGALRLATMATLAGAVLNVVELFAGAADDGFREQVLQMQQQILAALDRIETHLDMIDRDLARLRRGIDEMRIQAALHQEELRNLFADVRRSLESLDRTLVEGQRATLLQDAERSFEIALSFRQDASLWRGMTVTRKLSTAPYVEQLGAVYAYTVRGTHGAAVVRRHAILDQTSSGEIDRAPSDDRFGDLPAIFDWLAQPQTKAMAEDFFRMARLDLDTSWETEKASLDGLAHPWFFDRGARMYSAMAINLPTGLFNHQDKMNAMCADALALKSAEALARKAVPLANAVYRMAAFRAGAAVGQVVLTTAERVLGTAQARGAFELADSDFEHAPINVLLDWSTRLGLTTLEPPKVGLTTTSSRPIANRFQNVERTTPEGDKEQWMVMLGCMHRDENRVWTQTALEWSPALREQPVAIGRYSQACNESAAIDEKSPYVTPVSGQENSQDSPETRIAKQLSKAASEGRLTFTPSDGLGYEQMGILNFRLNMINLRRASLADLDKAAVSAVREAANGAGSLVRNSLTDLNLARTALRSLILTGAGPCYATSTDLYIAVEGTLEEWSANPGRLRPPLVGEDTLLGARSLLDMRKVLRVLGSKEGVAILSIPEPFLEASQECELGSRATDDAVRILDGLGGAYTDLLPGGCKP
jgi:hypothetical protein